MMDVRRAATLLAGTCFGIALAACGGGEGGSPTADPAPTANTPPAVTTPTPPTTPVSPGPITLAPPVQGTPVLPSGPGAPFSTGNIAFDGLEWINYRRSQVGMSTLTRNASVDVAALGHSDYLRLNNTITHEQIADRPGFTGLTLADRLQAAGYAFNTTASRAYGEVIAASSNGSGQYMAEELITAIYHRFVVFEPVFKEIGTGAATTTQGYNYLTINMAANNGFGAGLASGQVAIWPFSDQTAVPRRFFSDTELPDPVPDRNEVGYPISVHANIDTTIQVASFTVRPRGAPELEVRLLSNANDTRTGRSSAAIVPLAPLAANTVYDVTFTGTVGGMPVSRSWSFTTL